MPDLSALTETDATLEPFLSQLKYLRRGSEAGKLRPHKLVMLLAVFDLVDEGHINSNKIYFDETLINRFHNRFREFAAGNDLSQPSQPFFHLRSAEFWHHKIKPGREGIYATFTTSGGGFKRIQENIDYAFFDDVTYSVIADAAKRQRVADKIVQILGHE